MSRSTPIRPMIWVVALFLLSRFGVAYSLDFGARFEPDVDWYYARYASEFLQADQAGENPFAAVTMEYPLYSLAILVPPEIAVRQKLPADAPALQQVGWYRIFYRAQLAIFDAIGFGLVIAAVRRFFPEESDRTHAGRVAFYVLMTAALGELLTSRLDFPIGLLLLAGLMLLHRQRPLAATAMLLAGVGLKLVPIIFAPVWILAAAKSGARMSVLKWGVVFLVMLVGVAAVPYLLAGPKAYHFFEYHKDRPLEVESVPATFAVWEAHSGTPASYDSRFGSFNINTPSTPTLLAIAPILTLVLLAIPFLSLVRSFRQHQAVPPNSVSFFHHLLLTVLAIGLGFLIGNKVLSPQYLLWLIPLFVLIPLTGKRRWVMLGGFALLCIGTAIIWWRFSFDIQGDPIGHGEGTGPTRLGAILLTLRNGLLLILCGLVNLILFRRVHSDDPTRDSEKKIGGHP